MKYLNLILFAFFFCNIQIANATPIDILNNGGLGLGGYQFTDEGFIFTRTTFPQSVAKNLDGYNNINLKDLERLKKGESSTRNFFHLVEVGDASINRAAKKGGITSIKYIDSRTCKIYIPVFFIPIAVRETRTIVYGE